jgi:hypothetical protein
VADLCGEIQKTAMILRGRGRGCQDNDEKWWVKSSEMKMALLNQTLSLKQLSRS